MKTKTIKQWVTGLTKVNVPCGPINDLKQVFNDPQVLARKMRVPMKHKKSKSKKIDIIGSPMNFSLSKIKYKKSPPSSGRRYLQISKKIFKNFRKEIRYFKEKNII